MVAPNTVAIFDPEVGERKLNIGIQLSPQVGPSISVAGVSTISASGSAGTVVAGTGSDIVMAIISIPNGAFAALGNGIEITAYGQFLNNGNTKRAKIIFNATAPVVGQTVSGGTVIADTGAYSTAAASPWCLAGCIFKTGAAGSNTQVGLHQQAQIGSTVAALTAATALTATESGATNIVVTGNATSAAADISFIALTVVPLA